MAEARKLISSRGRLIRNPATGRLVAVPLIVVPDPGVRDGFSLSAGAVSTAEFFVSISEGFGLSDGVSSNPTLR